MNTLPHLHLRADQAEGLDGEAKPDRKLSREMADSVPAGCTGPAWILWSPNTFSSGDVSIFEIEVGEVG